MRFKQITLDGFRAFGAATTVNLDADVVIVVGANGQGKTSLLDGLFWALTGRLTRVGNDGALVSLYSETGGASVDLTLVDGTDEVQIVRRFDGQRTTLMCRAGGHVLSDTEVHSRFGRLVAPSSDTQSEAIQAFGAAMARSLYLQQDAIRDFIKADTDDERFRIVAELCGLGRVTDFQATLQQERRLWSQATNQFENDVTAKRSRVAGLRERTARLTTRNDDSVSDSSTDWQGWWRGFAQAVPAFKDPVPTPGSGDAGAALDRAARILANTRLESERHKEVIDEAIRLAQSLAASSPEDEAALKSTYDAAEAAEKALRVELRQAEEHNASVEELLLQAKSSAADMRTLAEIALRHLGDQCPVCAQAYDREATTTRLRRSVEREPEPIHHLIDLAPVLRRLSDAQRTTLDRAALLRDAQAKNARTAQALATLNERVHQLGLETTSQGVDARSAETLSRLHALRDDTSKRLELVSSLGPAAEKFSLALAKAGELAQRSELEQQLGLGRIELEEAESILTARERAGRVATSISEEMREASLQVVEQELQRIEPLLQRIWAGIDPHPSLRAVHLVSRLSYGKGRLSMNVRDDVRSVGTESPEIVLSSSQLNALAVALFLTLNLGTQSLPLAATVLDDPFQSLDDINLLGLIDLLRRVRGQRKLSTTLRHQG